MAVALESLTCALCPREIVIPADTEEYVSYQACALPLGGEEVLWFCSISCMEGHPRFRMARQRELDDELYGDVNNIHKRWIM